MVSREVEGLLEHAGGLGRRVVEERGGEVVSHAHLERPEAKVLGERKGRAGEDDALSAAAEDAQARGLVDERLGDNRLQVEPFRDCQ